MPMSCCVLGCTSRFSKGTDIKFFHFPLKDACQLTAWLSAIKRPNWNPSIHDRICNKHFTANDYLHRPDAHYTHLKRTAIPSIFPTFIKSNNKRNQCKIMKRDNENEKDEVDNVERNSNFFVDNFTSIHIEMDSTIDQANDNSYINIELIENDENIENVHNTIIEEVNTENEDRNVNLEIYDPETHATGELCIISSSIYESNNIEENQENDYDSSKCLECAELDCIKNSLSSTEMNLRHKIHILRQKLCRKDARIIYLRRVLTNLKQKQHTLSAIQHL